MIREEQVINTHCNDTLWLNMKDTSYNTMPNKTSVVNSALTIARRNADIVQNLRQHVNLFHSPSNSIKHIANLVYLDFSGSQLNNLPDCISILKWLRYLSLDNNQFSYLPNVVCKLSNLETLRAYKNCIREIPQNLENLLNLRDLDLSFNQLKDLPSSCAKLQALRNLFLANNSFKRIPNCIADGMENLQTFDFSYNFNSEINVAPKSSNLHAFYAENNSTCPLFPNWILNTKYSNLETVSMNETNFEKYDLPENIPKLYIKKLFMKQCKLSKLTIEKLIAEMYCLEELIIGNTRTNCRNYFWDIPIEKLKEPFNLRKLDVCNTGITMVPDMICNFVNLSVINVSDNNISWLPDDICSLKSLCSLMIHKNHLTTLPKNIGKLLSLKELKACNNYLYELPKSTEALLNLQFLDLYDNELEEVLEVMMNLPSLIGVDLEQNYFSTDEFSLNRGTRYKNMRDMLREHWPEDDRMFNGIKSKSPNDYDSLLDKGFSSSSSSSKEDLYKEYSYYSSDGIINQVNNLYWDTSEDSADEFDPHEKKEPKVQLYPPLTFHKPWQQIYCPAESHQPQVKTRVMQMLKNGTLVWSSNHEEGQFEDC